MGPTTEDSIREGAGVGSGWGGDLEIWGDAINRWSHKVALKILEMVDIWLMEVSLNLHKHLFWGPHGVWSLSFL